MLLLRMTLLAADPTGPFFFPHVKGTTPNLAQDMIHPEVRNLS